MRRLRLFIRRIDNSRMIIHIFLVIAFLFIRLIYISFCGKSTLLLSLPLWAKQTTELTICRINRMVSQIQPLQKIVQYSICQICVDNLTVESNLGARTKITVCLPEKDGGAV